MSATAITRYTMIDGEIIDVVTGDSDSPKIIAVELKVTVPYNIKNVIAPRNITFHIRSDMAKKLGFIQPKTSPTQSPGTITDNLLLELLQSLGVSFEE